jgi:tRNA modification GTPase
VSAGFDTIVAPATPQGRSALAIVRLDGPDALELVGQLGASDLTPRQATLVHLVDGEERLDEAIAIFYQAPHSFTGNDVVELNLHGGTVVVQRVLRALRRAGARLAEPGEFSERAVLNGRIDLIQAEAIHDLITARTSMQAKISLDQLDGHLSRDAAVVREELLTVVSRLEAALDFAEEGYEFISPDEVRDRLRALLERVGRMLATFHRGRAIVEGITAVILGQPNSGKSTMLNFLCGSERAIVTDLPGTTRDLLRETIELGGLPVTIVDTAGLRESTDVVEAIGVSRAREAAVRADLILYLVDAERGMDELDREEIARLDSPIVVYTKRDLGGASITPLVSAKTGEGMEGLLADLDGLIRERYSAEGEALVVNERQRGALEAVSVALMNAIETLDTGATEEVVLVDLYSAVNALGRLTGAITHGEILSEIFGKFCIGK